MAKPLIGLTGPSKFSENCIDTIENLFGANFVMIYHNKPEDIRYWVDRCSGIILAGGDDIHPTTYDREIYNNFNYSRFDLARDERELQIIERCDERKKPLFGICRGHQMIGVVKGLRLLPDISGSSVCHNPVRQQISLEQREPLHSVKLLNPDQFHQTFGTSDPLERRILRKTMAGDKNRLWVNSYHHQALFWPIEEKDRKKISEDLNITVFGVSRIDLGDKCKENIEIMGGENWISTQWHPEYDWRENTYSRAVLTRFGEMAGVLPVRDSK